MAGVSTYTDEIANEICSRLVDGKSLKKICEMEDMPSKATVFKWLSENEVFSDKYARARESQADTLADEIIDIADDGENDTYEDDEGNVRTNQDVIARSRLRVDARKWIASKLKPKKYGDKIQTDIQPLGKDGLPTDSIVQEVRFTLVDTRPNDT